MNRGAGPRPPLTSALMLLGVAAVVGAAIGAGPRLIVHEAGAPVHYAEPLGACTVTDGDTIRCAGERIRLLGIDAPELPDHCRVGRDCAPGDPFASTDSLSAAMVGQLTIERVATDHYGRTLALVAGDRGDLSCWQLRRHQAVYKVRWDNGLRVARACPATVLRWQ